MPACEGVEARLTAASQGPLETSQPSHNDLAQKTGKKPFYTVSNNNLCSQSEKNDVPYQNLEYIQVKEEIKGWRDFSG